MNTATSPQTTETRWETVIGLEIHAQLTTKTKLFSGCATDFGADPNTQACAIDLGLPGVLPVPNLAAIKMAILFGLAVDADIHQNCFFARKNYFYPDLPKGYQISQDKLPIVEHGRITVRLGQGQHKTIGIERAHLEEDAGKSVHDIFPGHSGIDLNRAGTPLLEIVSAPDMRSPEEAVAYVRAIHTLVRYLGICDGNMQEGSLRCDVNVSVRRKGETKLGIRSENKNINSFRFIDKAIRYEINRQIALLEAGESVKLETRLYDPDKDETRPMRAKEEAHFYRYFPDPDLVPLAIDDTWINDLRARLPELPWEKLTRLQSQYRLNEDEAVQLIDDPKLAAYFEQAAQASAAPAKTVFNWLLGEVSAALNKAQLSIAHCPVNPASLAQLLDRIADQTISGKIAKTVFEAMWAGEGEADHIIETRQLKQITDDATLLALINEIIHTHPQQVSEYRSGKDKLFGFFVGQMMQKTQGKANPEQVNALLKQQLITDMT